MSLAEARKISAEMDLIASYYNHHDPALRHPARALFRKRGIKVIVDNGEERDMAHKRYSKARRSAAAKKGWRNRKRGSVHRSSARKGGHRKSPKRVAAGKKAWRTKVRKYGRAGAIAMIGRKKGRGKRARRK